MMLPMVAFVFAVVGAVAGNFLPPINQGYYKAFGSCVQTPQNLDQSNCSTTLPSTRPVCTVNISGHPQAFADNGCNDVLRYIP